MVPEQPFQPKIGRILTRDYLALLLLIFPLVMGGLAIVTGVFGLSIARRGREVGPEAGNFFAMLAVLVMIIAIPLLILRVRSVLAFFRRAVQVRGEIQSVWISGDKGRVEYSYEYEGQAYASGNAITKNPVTQAFQENQELALLVDPENPKKAKIRDLFI